MGEFVHLHLHSEYSLLDGACRIKDIAARALECHHDAVALTDHGVMYGAVEFYRACRAAGIKPIIGCEVYVAQGSRFDKTAGSDKTPAHLVLLCKDNEGYKNLIKMVSRSFTEGFYSKPRVDTELLREYSGGLIALSACLAGKIPRALVRGEYQLALKAAREYADIFGKDNFFIELQDHGIEEQRQIIPDLVSIAEECGVGLVATNDCHYLRRRDADNQAVLMCIQMNTVVTDGRPLGFETDEFYYKDTSEMTMLFGKYKGAIENTVKIAERCNVTFDFDTTYLPKFPTPGGRDATEYLRELTEKGFERRIGDGTLVFRQHTEEEYRQRAEYELGVISEMGYSDYFLIVGDYVNFAKSKGIPVGPGRGSGAGSLVAFLLGITDIDSIKFDLLFERFLNPERVSMPDIDIDFCYNRRDEVIKYVGERYGTDHVSQIITFGTLAARAAIRDVGRAMGMAYSDVDPVARAIPQILDITISDAMKLPELKDLYESSEKVQKLVDTAMALEGMPRNVSIHAAGIVITDQPVSNYVPLSLSNGTVITQFDMDTIAALGLLKFDFLALRYLTIINDAQTQIRESQPDFDIENIPIDDKATYDLISKGSTGGVFQLESNGMKQVLVQLKPENIEDIIAVIALYRPGPMDSIPKYITCRHDPSKITYDTPELEPILKGTYGCTVYQEQVMRIFREIAGYTFGHADIVRRAMSKKKASVLEAERESFISGASARGMKPETAEKLFDDMSSFANYAFNKSHAAAYAVLSYRTAYLKAHYPQAFFSALLTSVLGNQTKIAEYIAESSKFGIRVLPPDINHSHADFAADGNNIRFGLAALKNVGVQFISAINSERTGNPFRSLEDFINRMSDRELNKRQVEALIKSGAFDGMGANRSQMLACYETMIDKSQERSRVNISGQMDMFAFMSADVPDTTPGFVYPDIPEFTPRDLLMLEKESSGLYFSGHILDGYNKCVESLGVTEIGNFFPEEEGGEVDLDPKMRVKVAGMITSVTTKNTKNDERMAFFRLEDRTGEIECLVFAKNYPSFSHLVRLDSAVYVEGNISVREDEPPKILVSQMAELIPNESFKPETAAKNREHADKVPAKTLQKSANGGQVRDFSSGKLYLRVPDMECSEFLKARNLVGIFDGGVPVVFYDNSTGKYSAYSVGCALDQFVFDEFLKILGDGNVIFK